MKVVCIHSKIQYSTANFYFRKNKIYDVYIKDKKKVIDDDNNIAWHYKYIEKYFIPLSKIRKNKILEIQKKSVY